MAETKETKVYFDQIVENQNQLAATLTEYVNDAVETMMPEKDFAEKATALMEGFFKSQVELAEELSSKSNLEKYQEDFWGTYSADMKKGMDLSMAMAQKAFDYVKGLYNPAMFTETQAKVKKYNEIAQQSMKAVMEASTANTKVVQEYFA